MSIKDEENTESELMNDQEMQEVCDNVEDDENLQDTLSDEELDKIPNRQIKD